MERAIEEYEEKESRGTGGRRGCVEVIRRECCCLARSHLRGGLSKLRLHAISRMSLEQLEQFAVTAIPSMPNIPQ